MRGDNADVALPSPSFPSPSVQIYFHTRSYPFFPLFYSMTRFEDSRITLDLRFSDFRIGFCSLMEEEFLKNFAGNIVVLFFERERQSDSRIIRLFLFEEKFLENLPSFRIQMKVNRASLR